MVMSLLRCIPLLLSAVTIAAAAPGPAELSPRACSKIPMGTKTILSRRKPDLSFSGGMFVQLERKQEDGGTGFQNTLKTVLSFTSVSPSDTGCQLEVNFPDLPGRFLKGPLATGEANQADIWLVKTPEQRSPSDLSFLLEWTWNNPPEKDQFVSTIAFPNESPSDSLKTILWSGRCDETVNFLLELSDWQQANGTVSYFETLGSRFEEIVVAFQLLYNC